MKFLERTDQLAWEAGNRVTFWSEWGLRRVECSKCVCVKFVNCSLKRFLGILRNYALIAFKRQFSIRLLIDIFGCICYWYNQVSYSELAKDGVLLFERNYCRLFSVNLCSWVLELYLASHQVSITTQPPRSIVRTEHKLSKKDPGLCQFIAGDLLAIYDSAVCLS